MVTNRAQAEEKFDVFSKKGEGGTFHTIRMSPLRSLMHWSMYPRERQGILPHNTMLHITEKRRIEKGDKDGKKGEKDGKQGEKDCFRYTLQVLADDWEVLKAYLQSLIATAHGKHATRHIRHVFAVQNAAAAVLQAEHLAEKQHACERRRKGEATATNSPKALQGNVSSYIHTADHLTGTTPEVQLLLEDQEEQERLENKRKQAREVLRLVADFSNEEEFPEADQREARRELIHRGGFALLRLLRRIAFKTGAIDGRKIGDASRALLQLEDELMRWNHRLDHHLDAIDPAAAAAAIACLVAADVTR